MCWDYSECGRCGKRTQCTASCLCSDDEECASWGHRSCKSFHPCETCYLDLCDDCYGDKNCDVCDKAYCNDCLEKLELHLCIQGPRRQ